MELAKLRILVEERKFTFSKDGFPVLYNPGELKLDKTANWSRVPTAGRDTTRTSFTHGDAYTLSVDLFFDTYETGEDVTDYTQRIVQLATVQGHLSRPPLCRLVWTIPSMA
jgi:Contractile injection system tube protein